MKEIKEIGLMYTRRCPLSCDHCISNSSPSARGKMDPSEALAYITAIAGFAEAVTFTGGEPLLYSDEVTLLIQKAKGLHLRTAVITSGGWGKSDDEIRAKVRLLAEAGLDYLVISWDYYHEKCLSRERPVSVAKAASSFGIPVHIRSYFNSLNINTAEEIYRPFQGYTVAHEKNRLTRIGRASALPDEHFFWSSAIPSGSCKYALMPVVDSDGSLYACCGPAFYSKKGSPLIRGSAHTTPLDTLLRAALKDPILNALSTIGPAGLLRLLKNHPASTCFRQRPRYSGICELCMDITDSPPLVAALKSVVTSKDTQRLITAARLYKETRERREDGRTQP